MFILRPAARRPGFLTDGEVKMSSLTLWSSPLADFDTVVRRTFGPSAFGSVRRTLGFTPAAEVTRDGSHAGVAGRRIAVTAGTPETTPAKPGEVETPAESGEQPAA